MHRLTVFILKQKGVYWYQKGILDKRMDIDKRFAVGEVKSAIVCV